MQITQSFSPASLALTALVLSGCATVQLQPPSGLIGGISATHARVVLRADQDVRTHLNVSYLLPAGEYRPVMENETGVYFEAPSKVFMRETFLTARLPNKPFDGGIFLERSTPQVAKLYITVPANQGGEIQRMLYGGRPAKPMLPREPVVFTLTRAGDR